MRDDNRVGIVPKAARAVVGGHGLGDHVAEPVRMRVQNARGRNQHEGRQGHRCYKRIELYVPHLTNAMLRSAS